MPCKYDKPGGCTRVLERGSGVGCMCGFALAPGSELIKPKPYGVRTLCTLVDQAIREVNQLILETPTGPARNVLCDAHIHLEAARVAIRGTK